jgi:hypothetical protein
MSFSKTPDKWLRPEELKEMAKNSRCRQMKSFTVAGIIFVFIPILTVQLGCGVRGRPQPPLTPPELGRGQPTFKRATEEFAFPAVPTPAPVH